MERIRIGARAALRAPVVVITLAVLLAPVVTGRAFAQNAQQTQTLLELRQLNESVQKLQLSVNALAAVAKDLQDQVKSVNGRLDAQSTQVRESFATQKTLTDSLTQNVGTLEQKVRDNNVDVRSLQTEMTAIRTGITSLSDLITSLSQGQAAAGAPGTGTADAGAGAAGTAAPPAPVIPDSPGQLFGAARGYYVSSQYDLAIGTYQDFLKQFPSSPEAPSAEFWIGESYYNQRKYKEAIEAYTVVVTKYAGCNCSAEPDSYFHRGMSYMSLKDNTKAAADFKKIQAEYAKTKSPLWQNDNDAVTPILKDIIK